MRFKSTKMMAYPAGVNTQENVFSTLVGNSFIKLPGLKLKNFGKAMVLIISLRMSLQGKTKMQYDAETTGLKKVRG